MLADGTLRHRARDRAPRPVLGAARRRRQLRRRHLVPVPAAPGHNVIAGPTLWPVAATAEVLRWYRDFLPAQHEDLYGFFAVMTVPPGDPFPEALHLQKVCGVVWCYTGDPADADAAFAPGPASWPPQFEGSGRCPTRRCRHVRRALPAGAAVVLARRLRHARSPDEAVDAHARFAERAADHALDHAPLPDRRRGPAGSARTTPRGATATPTGRRSSSASTRTRPTRRRSRGGRRTTGRPLHPYSAGGAYVNFMMDEGQDRVRATYRGNYDAARRGQGALRPGQPASAINQNIHPLR